MICLAVVTVLAALAFRLERPAPSKKQRGTSWTI